MSAEINSLDHDPDISADSTQLETGFYESNNASQHLLNYDYAGHSQTTASAGGETKEVRFESSQWPEDDHVNDTASPQQEQQGLKRVWSKAFDWVKDKQQDRLWGTSERPSVSHQSKEGNSSEVPNAESEDEKPPEQIYTKAAAETVSTFLRQDTLAAYPAETSYDPPAPPADDPWRPYDVDYVPEPEQYKPSLFGALLAYKINHLQNDWETSQKQTHSRPPLVSRHGSQRHKRPQSVASSLPTSGTATPNRKLKWYEKPEQNNPTAAALMQAALSTTRPIAPTGAIPRPKAMRPKSADMISTAVDIITHGKHHHHSRNISDSTLENHVGLITEVADIIARRDYLIKLCGALMEYGAPTHRIEEYLSASARSLLIDADFLHIPGAMICSFADRTIHANNIDIVRKSAGLDFARLKDVFNVYKCVIHDKLTAEDAIREIDEIRRRPDNYSEWFRIFLFGVASVVVGPFSFQSRPIDFGPIFVLGCVIGFMQVKIVPRSEHFSNVFEVFACVFAAFLARALGSIKYHDGQFVFCFSAIAQSTIAMILPGFMMLNSALELQSRNLISGSVRMVYVIVYVLFLAFGLLIGTTIFGLIKHDAVSTVQCEIPSWFEADMDWKLIHTRFIWAPLFACCVGLIYQAKWKQLPVMALIATCGHQANFWISTQLSSNPQVANAIGAFVIGCISNLYSRLFHGVAATAMLPAIYCQVPGGLASSGSLVAGIMSANQIAGNRTANAHDSANNTADNTIFGVGYAMVQVAIGISVGLYLSALVVYPYGKRKSALGSF
ncbi:hypothetical protein H2200_013340 [Cladophialophora chaetospira]|uniref:Pheromone-regulated membrane protein 10 n=1 Tax=Cladophialophora chaetospira TaxID=386627 RepID=A0AA38WW43_9EURO|nr:hypothetical protein H2200_013340 [Cladophialophora chaetospira]